MSPAFDLAHRYAQALAALRAIHDFDEWLGQHWHERCPPPVGRPAACTPLGDAGAITWHESPDQVVGYLPGDGGCFQFARGLPLPDFPLAGELPAMPYGKDILISAAMQEELRSPDR